MSRLAIGSMIALSTVVFAKVPLAGIVAVEREFEVYPVVSQETVASMDDLNAAYAEFDRACYCYKSGAGADIDGESYEGQASPSALKSAVDHRRAAAAKLDPSLLTAVVLGVNYHTHASWTCEGSSHNPVVNVSIGLTATYEQPRDNKRELVLVDPA